ncbi:hypothetical protein CFP65_0065 [Kitasatospora sp. MMS16-BH015]|uniref:hypothetical protein n=1 Tax=Kitasatospora sp. MMS16-BH015 TaxID=2018025 RepID=UPI000CA3D857|nr:hypothetical protein [Kitasatospora sp. MMS16-BH015]AUG75051.1 hypothetical protein CFP65_0065 [Kitasatospora sp. MMS16-BH015]
MRIVGVDIGSVAQGRFAWAALEGSTRLPVGEGIDPEGAAQAVAEGLRTGGRVVLALEAPMSVPVPPPEAGAATELGRARTGERNRPWSAGAGAGVLVTGLAQGAWLLARIRTLVPTVTATTQPERFPDEGGGERLLLIEAMVTGSDKSLPVNGSQDLADARTATAAGWRALATGRTPATVCCAPKTAFNLLAAISRWAQVQIEEDELRLEVLVARAVRPEPTPVVEWEQLDGTA